MSVNKIQQLNDKKKTFEDLMKSIDKDEVKAKKNYDEKMSEILSKKRAFEEQLKNIQKEEMKVQKAFDDKMAEISPKKKTFEETLKSIEKDEAKIKKHNASAKVEESDDDSKKVDSISDKTYKKKSIPKKIKELVWNNHIGHDIATFMCVCCEKTPIKNTEFHCGHVLAEANGGTLDITNLRPICAGCNLSMGTQNMDDFKKAFGLGKKEKKPVITQKKTD